MHEQENVITPLSGKYTYISQEHFVRSINNCTEYLKKIKQMLNNIKTKYEDKLRTHRQLSLAGLNKTELKSSGEPEYAKLPNK